MTGSLGASEVVSQSSRQLNSTPSNRCIQSNLAPLAQLGEQATANCQVLCSNQRWDLYLISFLFIIILFLAHEGYAKLFLPPAHLVWLQLSVAVSNKTPSNISKASSNPIKAIDISLFPKFGVSKPTDLLNKPDEIYWITITKPAAPIYWISIT